MRQRGMALGPGETTSRAGETVMIASAGNGMVAISRSRGLDRGGAVLPGGGDAYRLFDSLIRRVPAFSDGVREHIAVWSNGVSKKGSSFFTGRAYSSLLAPLLACLCPAVLPDRTLRRQLIHLLEYGLWFFTVARNPSSYYGGLAATAELLGNIASTIDSYLWAGEPSKRAEMMVGCAGSPVPRASPALLPPYTALCRPFHL